MKPHKSDTPDRCGRFLCIDDDPESRTRCREQCEECKEIQRHEREDEPEGEDTNVEDSYAR